MQDHTEDEGRLAPFHGDAMSWVDSCSVPPERVENSAAMDGTSDSFWGSLATRRFIVPTQVSPTPTPAAPGLNPALGSAVIAYIAVKLWLDKSGQIRSPLYPDVMPGDINPRTGRRFEDLREWANYQNLSEGQTHDLVSRAKLHCLAQLRNATKESRQLGDGSADSVIEGCPLQKPVTAQDLQPVRPIGPEQCRPQPATGRRPNEFSKSTQKEALWRQRNLCGSCGVHIAAIGEAGRSGHLYGEGAQGHHIKPIHCGGSDHVDNCVILCQACHYSVHEGGHYRPPQRAHSQDKEVVGTPADFPYYNGPRPIGDGETPGIY